MLGNNIKALHIASALMNKDTVDPNKFTQDELQEALRALTSMISKTDKARVKFKPGTSQHTLQRNRLKAMQIAESLVKEEFNKG